MNKPENSPPELLEAAAAKQADNAVTRQELRETKATCCYCGVGCGVIIQTENDRITGVRGDPDHPANFGRLCTKGSTLHLTARHDLRALYPEMRLKRDESLQPVSWDGAIDHVAQRFAAIIRQHGPDAVAFYISGQLLTEDYYVFNKLAKGLIGTNNIDTNSRLCMSSAVAGYKATLGADAPPACYEDIDFAKVLFIAGSNTAYAHPIVYRRIEDAKAKDPELRIIVVDPRRTDTAQAADMHLPIQPGTDVALFNGMLHVMLWEGLVDMAYIRAHTEGFDTLKETVREYTPKLVADICGIPEADIVTAAKWFGVGPTLSLYCQGLNQSTSGTEKNAALINLHLATGQIGKPGAGPFSLTGQPNAMGGREVGGMATLLPGHRDLKNADHREELQQFWGGRAISDKAGLTATEIFEALNDDRLKAIWIICTNPLTSLPNARLIEEGLKKARFVVVQDVSNKVETLKYADVILPAAAWAEKEGTMTNSERRISYLNKIIDAPGEALPDTEIICRFAQKMGYPGFEFEDQAAIYAEHAALTADTNIDISGLNYDILKKEKSVQWPYPKVKIQQVTAKKKPVWLNEENVPLPKGTARLFTDRTFYTPTTKAVIYAVPDENTSEQPDSDFPFILTTGRIRDQWHTMSKTGKVNKLNQHIKQAFLEIHPADAAKLQIGENDVCVIRSRRGEVQVKAKIGPAIKRGVVFLPMHWGKILDSDLNRANNVTNDIVDPLSKEPDFKFCAVSVQKYKKPFQRIVIIGAGAGAYGFVKSYREINTEDEITIFSKENFPFYNRVMLPDYISGEQRWEQLVKMTDEEEPSYKIKMLRGVSVEKVNREEKFVIDSRGIKTPYDVLIMATGSRAAIPRNVPALPGIFSMRSRTDADNFKEHIPAGGHVVIVGGGLLGLEMAASLREIGMRITVIQRTSRFLNRQLDDLGSQLLHEEIIDQGCDVYYDDEVQLYYGRKKLTGIGLKSGVRIDCDAMILAIGTTPNLELAKNSGLECKRGVTVDHYLRTSDPNIYAIGEIAEFEGTLFGITAAAEQQAEVVARYLNGDIASYYKGSLFMNIIKIHGFDLCSIGLPECPDDPAYEEITFIDKAKRYYKKCIIHQDRLVGTILIGDKSEFQEFKELIANKTELSEKRMQLLRSGNKADPVIGKLVCSCNNVGAGNITNKIAEGCTDLKQLCTATGAGTGCGSCRPEVKRILDEALQAAGLETVS